MIADSRPSTRDVVADSVAKRAFTRGEIFIDRTDEILAGQSRRVRGSRGVE